MCMGFCLHIRLCIMCLPDAYGGQRGCLIISNGAEQLLKLVLGASMWCWELNLGTWVPYKNSQLS